MSDQERPKATNKVSRDKIGGTAKGFRPTRTLLYMYAGAQIGALSANLGSALSSTSEVLSMAGSSIANSTGFSILSGGEIHPNLNFGIGSLDLSTGDINWADFHGDTWEVIGDIGAYSAVTQDLSKLEYELLENKKTKDYDKLIQKYTETHTPIEHKGKWDYWDVTELNKPPQPNYHFIQKFVAGKGGDQGSHFRTRKYHIVKNELGQFIVHVNQYPSAGLSGLLFFPHCIFEGSVNDIFKWVGWDNQPISITNITNKIDLIRWRFSEALKYRYAFHEIYY